MTETLNISKDLSLDIGSYVYPEKWPKGKRQEKRLISATQNKEAVINEVKVEEVVRAKIGSGPDELGVVTPLEANPEGSMIFVISAA